MKLSIKNRRLRGAFGVGAMAAIGRSTRPILEHVLVTAKADGTVLLRSQSAEQSVEVELRDVEVSKPGEALAHKVRFSSVLGAIESKHDLSIEKQRVGYGLEVVYGVNELFTVPTDDETCDFGSAKKHDEFDLDLTLDLAAVASLCQAVVGAAASSADAGRCCTDHVLFAIHPDGKLRAIATDGKRLVVSEGKHEVDLEKTTELFLPKATVRFLHRLWNDTPRKVRIQTTKGVGVFTVEEADARYTQTVSLGAGAFAPYEPFLEKRDWKHEIRVNREKLQAAVQRVLAVQLTGDYEQVAFLFRSAGDKTEVRVAGIGEDHSLAATKIEIESPWEGDPFEIAFNPRFIMSSLGEIPDATVWWRFSDNGGQCLLEGSRTRVVLIPIHPGVPTVLHDAMDYARNAKLEKTHA